MRLVGWALLAWLVTACGLTQHPATEATPAPDASGGSAGVGGTAGGGTNAGMEGGGASTSADVPLAPAEYWIHSDALGSPLHVRIVSPTAAIVWSSPFTIERSDAALGADAGFGGASTSLLRGPVVLRAPSDALGSIAVTAGPNGELGDEALILLGSSSSQRCLQPPLTTWRTVEGSVEPDLTETEVHTTGGADTPLGALPWGTFYVTASKPAQDVLSKDTYARVGPEQEPVEITWSDSSSTIFAYGSLPEWAALAGREVELGGRLLNTNGAGLGGATEWTVPLQLLDFGPSRSGLLDFSQGAPADLVLWGGAQALEDDAACATDDAPDARSCLRINPGAGLALRLAGPLVGLRIQARVQGLSAPAPMLPSTTLVPANGTPQFVADVAHAFESPVEDVFALVAVPTTFNTQLDPACANEVTAVVLVDAIEPLP